MGGEGMLEMAGMLNWSPGLSRWDVGAVGILGTELVFPMLPAVGDSGKGAAGTKIFADRRAVS